MTGREVRWRSIVAEAASEDMLVTVHGGGRGLLKLGW